MLGGTCMVGVVGFPGNNSREDTPVSFVELYTLR